MYGWLLVRAVEGGGGNKFLPTHSLYIGTRVDQAKHVCTDVLGG